MSKTYSLPLGVVSSLLGRHSFQSIATVFGQNLPLPCSANEIVASKDQDLCIENSANEIVASKDQDLCIENSEDEELVQNSSVETATISSHSKTSTSVGDGEIFTREAKLGHRRVAENGEVTYKKIYSSHLRYSIQLGLSHAVGGMSEKPERDILMQDFKTVESRSFSFEGSEHTPDAHRFSDFCFESFAPIAFQYFRNIFCINPQDFLLSLCNMPLRELSNPGASGSIFYVSADDEFIIKTVQHKEGEFLRKLLPGYSMNLNQNPRTLLPKFFGFYSYISNAKNVRMVVMNNILPSSIKFHEKFDLKGSTYKRKASQAERSKTVPTLKDLDFLELHPNGIMLEVSTYNALINTIKRDCRVLESFKIMDYSLLLAIHNIDLAAREEAELRVNTLTHKENCEAMAAEATALRSPISHRSNGLSTNGRKMVAHSTILESIQMEYGLNGEEDYAPPHGIPARNAKGERLLVFLGIIDVLQNYRLEKKLEHTLKATILDGDSISVHRPKFYSERFQNFMEKQVFKNISSL